MNRIARSLWVTGLLALSCLACGAPERISNFSLIDQNGISHELRKYGDQKAVVIIAQSASCLENIDQQPSYRLLRTTWERQGVSFLMVNSATGDSLESIRRSDALYHFDMPILLDQSQLVAEELGIERAGQLIIVEPTRFQVLYRGGLDIKAQRAVPDRGIEASAGTSKVADILQGLVAGEASLNDTVNLQAPGCTLNFPARDRDVATVPDYAKDVAPILQEKCISCHSEGGIGPFAMNSHQMVQGWSPMIREVLMTRRMPPAQVDPHVRHFENARYMEPDKLQTLVHWIDAGAPRGRSDVDPLTRIPPTRSEWDLGEPDFVLDVPDFVVPATGVLDYQNVTINLPFTDDKWIKSVQFVPGDRRVLHHLLGYIVPSDYAVKIVEGENDNYREFLEGYAPGKDEAATYPADSGVFIPAGSAVQMSIHYTTFGKEVVDQTRLGLWFADTEPHHQYSTYALSNGGSNIIIPPGEKDHQMSASHVFEDEVMLYGVRPHMHYRGSHMRFSVVYPDGTRDDILNVPDYNFAWQPTYRLSEPMLLPAGSRVVVEGGFDNSEFNLGNPDPTASVNGGPQSWDEMFIGYFSYYRTLN